MHSSSASMVRSDLNHSAAHSICPVGYWSRCSISIVLSFVTAVIALIPGLAGPLQFDRAGVAAGEWWRIVTGHFVHWNSDHVFWDLLVFASLGALCEWRDRRRFVLVLSLAGVIIPAAIWVCLPHLATYRGLSGMDSALFALLAASFLQEQWQQKRWGWVFVISGLLLGLAAKIGYELVMGKTLFVDATAAGFEPVPLAHMAGAAVGLAIAFHGYLPVRRLPMIAAFERRKAR